MKALRGEGESKGKGQDGELSRILNSPHNSTGWASEPRRQAKRQGGGNLWLGRGEKRRVKRKEQRRYYCGIEWREKPRRDKPERGRQTRIIFEEKRSQNAGGVPGPGRHYRGKKVIIRSLGSRCINSWDSKPGLWTLGRKSSQEVGEPRGRQPKKTGNTVRFRYEGKAAAPMSRACRGQKTVESCGKRKSGGAIREGEKACPIHLDVGIRDHSPSVANVDFLSRQDREEGASLREEMKYDGEKEK